MPASAWSPDYVWNFGFASARMIGDQSQVLPAMSAAFTLAYLEKFFNKITPSVIRMIVVPFCSLVLAVMDAHFILGPDGQWQYYRERMTGRKKSIFLLVSPAGQV